MSTGRVSDLATMISGMAPSLRDGLFVFVSLDPNAVTGKLQDAAIAVIREEEGVTLILPLDAARADGLAIDLPMRQITLTVHSALEGVGLTAAFASELARHDIPANVVAGYHHDHVFVPVGKADDALAALGELASRYRSPG